MSNNYSEQIFQAIDKIVSQRLNEVSFDKTEICTVISKDPDYTGKYSVTNEAGLTYDAYSTDENISYYEDQKIYVTVPQGDYTLRKLILGSYFGDDIPQNLYVNPFDRLVVSSEYNWIKQGNTLSATAYKNGTRAQVSYLSNEITFYYSGLGQFNYIGLDFAATTDFGGTEGEFQIIIDLLDKSKNSLLTQDELGLLTYSSKQLYGNPYYLNKTLRFQHLFNFPVGNFSDLTLVKHVRITLVTKGNFNYEGDIERTITLEDLILYFGFDSSENNMSKNKIVLDLDEPDGTKEVSKSYTNATDIKKMSIDWVMTDTTAVYNETDHRQYPEAKKYNIYWLQYSESIGYKKMLESVKPDILSCYPKDKEVTKEEYSAALNEKFKNAFDESIEVYDKALYDKYVSFYQTPYAKFKAKIESVFIDITESGTYWKTVKKMDAHSASAYTYSLSPAPTWKNEQIKVIIKAVDSDDYLKSDSITFTNTEFRQATGSNQGKGDTLKLTLATGDDGIYNSYGIDNKLLTKELSTHKLTVSYIDESLENLWNNNLQKVVWKIPKHASMITVPKIKQETDNGFEFVEDTRWDKTSDSNFYIYTNTASDDAKTIEFNLSEQFGHNKTNNTIYCEITRYKSATLDYPDDTYQGSIKLQFGTQGTSGSAYAFNIYPNTSDGLLTNGSGEIKFAARLENNSGESVPFNPDNVKWYFLYGGEEVRRNEVPTGDVYTVTKDSVTFEGKNKYYFTLVAELTGWTDTTGNNINLKAYYPIPHSAKKGYYISGASRVVYNYQGSSPNYDQSAYTLYDQYHHKIPVAHWEIRFPNWSQDKYWTTEDGKKIKTGYWNNFPSLKKISETSSELRLQPLPNIQSNVLACNVTAYDNSDNILWAQPLLIIRNSYAFDVLNSWDGNLLVDAQGNKILSQLIGAGIKNDDNSFTGVLMGAVGKYGSARTGLYGFQSGNLRYKLDEQGDFYVGTGNDTKIDFTSGKLDINAKSFKLQVDDSQGNNKLYLSSTARSYGSSGKSAWLQFSDKVYFNSDGSAIIGGWSISQNEIYATSQRSVDKVKYPFKTFMSKSGSNAFGVYYTKNDTDIYPFKVTHDGKLYASGAEIGGKFTINAESTLNGTDVSRIKSATITSTPESIALKAFEQETTINGVTTTLNAHLKLNADNISAKVSKTIDSDNQETMSWNLTSGSFTVKANGAQVMKVTSSGMNLRGTLDITNGATINGKVQPGNLNVAGIISAGSADIQGIVKATEISADKITAGTLSATRISGGTLTIGNITWSGAFGSAQIPTLSANKISGGTIDTSNFTVDSYVKLLTNGHVEFTNSTGFFIMGPANGSYTASTVHPYMSGANIGTAGLAFRNMSAINQDPSIYYPALFLNSSGGSGVIKGGNNLNLSSGNEISGGSLALDSDGYLRMSAGNKSSAGSNSGSVYVTASAHISLRAGTDGHVYAGANGWNSGSNSQIETAAGTISSRSTKTNVTIIDDKFYNDALQFLQDMQLYTYNYKYDLYSNNAQYGFIIDEIEEQDKEHHFLDITEQMAWTRGRYIDFCMEDRPQDDDKVNNIVVKNYNRDAFTKYLLTCSKALYNKILILEQEIKELKNEI